MKPQPASIDSISRTNRLTMTRGFSIFVIGMTFWATLCYVMGVATHPHVPFAILVIPLAPLGLIEAFLEEGVSGLQYLKEPPVFLGFLFWVIFITTWVVGARIDQHDVGNPMDRDESPSHNDVDRSDP